MPISTSDLHQRLSVTTGSAGNSTAQGNVNNSLGKYMSTTDIVDASLDNLFDDVTGDENASSNVDYRCFFIFNNHGSLTLKSAVAWISANASSSTTKAIGLDPAGVVSATSASAQAATIANDTSAPAGVSFSSPTTKATGLSIGDIPAGSCQAIWVRRTATNSAATNSDGATIRAEGDTTA
jgi:hypothetical protein